MTRIRRASAADMQGIAGVVKDLWERDILLDVCAAHIDGDSSALWVATDEADTRHLRDRRHPADSRHPGQVVGFASAFLTRDMSGHGRWEVDLVAVRPASQGQGLGTRLITHVCDVGESNEVSLARALIRVENIASHRAFEHVGFTTDGQVHQLLLWSPTHRNTISRDESEVNGSPSIQIGNVILLRIDTLTYRGVWIEGLMSVCPEEQRLAVKTARAIAARDHRDNTGTVIPVEKVPFLDSELREEGVVHGEYYWFVKSGRRT